MKQSSPFGKGFRHDWQRFNFWGLFCLYGTDSETILLLIGHFWYGPMILATNSIFRSDAFYFPNHENKSIPKGVPESFRF